MPAPITDPGVTVATGDPEKISAAGSWHSRLASTLESHSSLIKSTAGTLLTGGWSGEASQQFHNLTREMSGHYEVTAAEARACASALKRFSAELGTAQGQGRVALKNAVHWMNQVNEWQNKLAAAEKAKTKAEADVQGAMGAVVTATHAASAPHAGPGAAGAVHQAQSNLQQARGALAKAQTDEATAKKNLKNAAEHFTMWQKKGGQALQEAEKAAGVAGLALGAVAITSPPLANAIDTVENGVSTSDSASVFFGYSASDGGGSSLANWQGQFQAGVGASATASGSASATGVQGDANVDAFAGEKGSVTGNVGWSQLGATGTVNEMGGAEVQGDANGQFGLSGVDASAGGSAFAGVQADASGTANLGPASASGHVGVSAGVGASADGSVDVSAHKIGFSWHAGVTLGVGFNFGGSVSVDPGKLLHDAEPWHWHL